MFKFTCFLKFSLMCFFFLFIGNQSLSAQLNIDSLSHIDYQQLHGANLNDVWGYVDELGNEYAIVGTSKGTSIVNITDGANPQEVFWLCIRNNGSRRWIIDHRFKPTSAINELDVNVLYWTGIESLAVGAYLFYFIEWLCVYFWV